MNTLEILSCTYHKDGSLMTTYRFNGQDFTRGIVVPERLALHVSNEDPIAVKLQQYIALADVVYCYDLDYFDEVIVPFPLDEEEINYFETTFFKGLAEFRYTNSIDLTRKTIIRAPRRMSEGVPEGATREVSDARALILNGGGKDGAVACEIAKQLGLDLTWCSLTGREIRRKVARVSGVDKYLETERIPTNMGVLPKRYAGHKPMSMFVAMVSALIAYLDGQKYIIAANEYSANFPNVEIDGQAINHQYTKSVENEVAMERLFDHAGIPIRYFSITRPLYELQIMKIFARYPIYHHEFISCNQGLADGIWCLQCPKCAFVVGALYIFDQASAESVWGPKTEVYSNKKQLVDESIELINPDVKPFECIGTTEENAVLLAKLLKDVSLTDEQQDRYRKYQDAISDRPFITLETLNDSEHFPDNLRSKILAILTNGLTTGEVM